MTLSRCLRGGWPGIGARRERGRRAPRPRCGWKSAPGAAAGIATSTSGAIAAIVAIACMNLATILVARGAARTRELNIRLALGASRLRLLRQLTIESLIVSAAGCVAGLLIVTAGLRLFDANRPAEIPSLNLAIDWRVAGFAVLAAIVSMR